MRTDNIEFTVFVPSDFQHESPRCAVKVHFFIVYRQSERCSCPWALRVWRTWSQYNPYTPAVQASHPAAELGHSRHSKEGTAFQSA